MRIVVVGPNSVHVSSFISGLGNKGITPILIAEERCDFANVEKEYTISFRDTNPLKLVRAVSKLKKVLKELKPDIVHIHQVNRLAYFTARACAQLSIPVITTAWGSDVLVIPQANKFYRFLVRKTLERSRVVTADSQEMIGAMQVLIESPSKYRLLQYGVDLIEAQQKENIIYSNRMHEPIYRIDQVIRYSCDFIKSHPDWRLVVGAVGSQTEELKQLAKELRMEDKVQFVGWLQKDDNRNWYSRSRVFISIPKHDGTAVSLLEAMSSGCIPIVSDLSVSKEYIADVINIVIEKKDNPLF